MKYFTREELEDITTQIIENPTRETLKKLNEKYNGSEVLALEIETPIVEQINSNEEAIVENTVAREVEPPFGLPLPVIEEQQPVENTISNSDAQNIETDVPQENELSQSVNMVSSEIPSFQLPTIDTPINNVQNNEPINFTGNLFEPQPTVPNLMETTDNFNTVQNTMPTTEVPISGTPFFGPYMTSENNPITVNGPTNNMSVPETTMFGQMQQNYM